MAKIKLTGESSGYVEISAGNAAGNNILETPTSGTRLVAHEGSQDVTLNGSLNINGDVVVGGGLTITNVLSYEDVSNIDAIGVVTARSGVHVGTEASGTLITGNSTGIGIGTDNPQYTLDISNGSSSGMQIGVGTHSYRVRANVSSTNDYGFYIEDNEENDLYNARGKDATSNSNTHRWYTTPSGSTVERLRIGPEGQIGLGGANYGTNNQVITSTGTGTAPVWSGVNAAFYGRQDASHNVSTSTWTVVKNLGSDAVNTTGWDESTGTFTADANTAGTWYIFGCAGIDDVQTHDVVYMGVMKNGANPPVYTYSRSYSTAANAVLGGGMVAGVFTLSDGDTISIGVYHNEGSTEPTEPNRCFVGGFRLSV